MIALVSQSVSFKTTYTTSPHILQCAKVRKEFVFSCCVIILVVFLFSLCIQRCRRNIEHPKLKRIFLVHTNITRFFTHPHTIHTHTLFISVLWKRISFRFDSFRLNLYFVRACVCASSRTSPCVWYRKRVSEWVFLNILVKCALFLLSNFTRLSDMETNQFHCPANDRTLSLWTLWMNKIK